MSRQITREAMPSTLEGTLGLCYFNPETDSLHEFSGDTRIVLGPFEESVRRFYIVKPSNTISGKVFSYVKLTVVPSSPAFIVKSKVGDKGLSSASQFEEIDSQETIAFFNNFPNGLIPVDFYTKNNTSIEAKHDMKITIEVF